MGEGLCLILTNFNNAKFLLTSHNTAYLVSLPMVASLKVHPSVATSDMLETVNVIYHGGK